MWSNHNQNKCTADTAENEKEKDKGKIEEKRGKARKASNFLIIFKY